MAFLSFERFERKTLKPLLLVIRYWLFVSDENNLIKIDFFSLSVY